MARPAGNFDLRIPRIESDFRLSVERNGSYSAQIYGDFSYVFGRSRRRTLSLLLIASHLSGEAKVLEYGLRNRGPFITYSPRKEVLPGLGLTAVEGQAKGLPKSMNLMLL